MRQITTPAIVLRRTNYGEADRIVSFLTPAGKLNAIVKGVRRSKSRLAGGIELFSISSVTFMETRGDLARIISTRLETHFDAFLGDLTRMMFGYEAMKLMDKIIDGEAGPAYYELLKLTLEGLSDLELPLVSLEQWFYLRLLKLQGHEPNLKTDLEGKKLSEENLYEFSPEDMCFRQSSNGGFRADHVKIMRLSLTHQPGMLKQIKNSTELTESLRDLTKDMVNFYIH